MLAKLPDILWFYKVVGYDKIDCLIADREFIGAGWFA